MHMYFSDMITILFGVIAASILVTYGVIFLYIVRYEYEMECIYRYAKMILHTTPKGHLISGEILEKRREIKKEYERAIEIVCKKQRRLLKLVPHIRRAYL